MMYFLGVGLISGSIVHVPLDPIRYSIILIIGAILFSFASYLSEFSKKGQTMKLTEIIRIILFSLTLSIGIGMVSGGIQHFYDIGIYATYLIPIGFVLSVFGFIYKNNTKVTGIQWGVILILILVIALPLKSFLSYEVSKSMSNDVHGEEEHHHGDDHHNE